MFPDMCGKLWEQLSSTRHPIRCEITLNFCNGSNRVRGGVCSAVQGLKRIALA